MTLANGGPVHILVPSRAPICPESDAPAVHDEVSPGSWTPARCVSVANRPKILPKAADWHGRWPERRTTIA